MESLIALFGLKETALALLAAYLLGAFSKSKAYAAARAALGKASYAAGDFISGLATSKLGKVVWGPLEAIFVDFVFVFFEQFCAGLRNDNVEKLETQAKRLEDVGSIFRREALESKLDILKDPRDKELLKQVDERNKARSEDMLKE